MTTREFAKKYGIFMKVDPVDHRPDLARRKTPRRDNQSFYETADHWRCVLYRKTNDGTRRLTVYFSMGPAFKGRAPTVDEVLESLSQDMILVEEGFEEATSSLGENRYDLRWVEDWQILEKLSKKLKKFLGQKAYREMVEYIEA